MEFDLLITGGEIVDGTGAPRYRADLGVCGDRIAAIGNLAGATAKQTIPAEGLMVAPGFVDPHTHAHNEMRGGILNIPSVENMLRQGVTTIIAGNCGGSVWPLDKHLAAVAQAPIRQNYAMLLGMGTLRAQVVKEAGRPATRDEIAAMRDLALRGMDEGALGISTGYFPPYVTTDEIVEVTRAVAEKGGLYVSHIRDEGDRLLGAVEEIIEIGARAELPVQISHIKTYGQRNWFKAEVVLRLMEQARARGVDIMADRYPYHASFSGVGALLPAWLRSEASLRGGMKSLRDPDWRPRVQRAVADHLYQLMGGPQNVVLAPLNPKPEMDGKRLDEYAAGLGQDPVDTIIDDLLQRGGISCIYFVMSEENIETFYRHPLVMGGSDGHLRVFGEGMSHPRNYGTFPRIIGYYGRERGLFTVEEAVKKCTSMAAGRFGLKDRGVLAKGKIADIVCFNWSHIRDRSTFEAPHAYPVGIPWVVVNGGIAVAEGEVTEGCFGRVVRRGE